MKKSNTIYYIYLFTVTLIWGISPLINVYFLKHFSATVYTALGSFFQAVIFTLLSLSRIKLINKSYFKVAIITSFFYSFANVSQKIGLQYTTPGMYAFLENTSCIVVPVIMLLMFKEKLTVPTALSCVLCFLGCFILSNASFNSGFGTGEFLCALAGVLFSGNIIGTGIYGKNMDPMPYLMIQNWTNTFISFIVMLILNFTKIDGVPVEAIVFCSDILILSLMVLNTLVTGALCWLLRTVAVTKINISAVTVIMCLPAVITSTISVLLGIDKLSFNFVTGAIIISFSVILSGLGDTFLSKIQKLKQKKF